MKLSTINSINQNSRNFCARLGSYNGPGSAIEGVGFPSAKADSRLAELIKTSQVLDKCLATNDYIDVSYPGTNGSWGKNSWENLTLSIGTKYGGKKIRVEIPVETKRYYQGEKDWDMDSVGQVAAELEKPDFAENLQDKIMTAYRKACIEEKLNAYKAQLEAEYGKKPAEKFDLNLVG